MLLTLQAKLLKFSDNHEIRGIGATGSIKVTCSTIAATYQNLADLVKKKLYGLSQELHQNPDDNIFDSHVDQKEI